MRALVDAHDWSSTPLGAREQWSPSLKLTVEIILASAFPMALRWGPDFVLVYNDAYRPILGDKHPWALGRPAREAWAEVWDQIEPAHTAILDRQSSSIFAEDILLRIQRHGTDWDDARFTLGYSPVEDPTAPTGIGGVFVTAVEITDRVVSEATLRASEERQRHLLQQMPGFVGVLSGPDHVYAYVNDAYVTISGPREFVGRGVREVFPELAGQGVYELLDRVYATGEPFSASAMPLRLTGEEEDRYIDLLYQPIRNDLGAVTGIFVGGYDITERVREQVYRDALIRLTDRISDLVDPDTIAFVAAETLAETLKVSRVGYGTIDPVAETLHVGRDWNAPGVETLAGTVPLRAYGSFIDSLKRGEFISIDNVDLDERTASAAEALKGRSAASFMNVPVVEQGRLVAVLYVNHAEVRTWSSAEHALIKEVASRTRIAAERSRTAAALRDLNTTLQERIQTALREQAEMEEALRQSQKMEAVGQLTGGLAHDFNNLLAGISGSLELMQIRMQQGRLADVDRYMAAAQSAAKRAGALTHRLLAFSRRQTLDPKPTNVNRLVSGMQDLIERAVGPAVQIEVVGASDLWPAFVDPPQLENALLNLCINARDAMPNGGRVTIETANKWLDERAARQRDMPEGQYLSLCVTDTGTGMSPGVIARAFEPFFTTKPIGEGTGLGLSMIYGFAKQSGGEVRIYSEVGQGTTVCIYLPRHYSETADEGIATPPAELPRSEHGATVLVVDDEPIVRMLLTEIVEDLGYMAIEAADGPAGLKVLQSDTSIDLLVTDVGLPGGMNGRQMADAGRVSRPDLAVLFITGYAENALFVNGRLAPGMAVLTKPFPVETMAARIRSMVEAKRDSDCQRPVTTDSGPAQRQE
jgi:signal transduction histidine kinase/PAS domain-containing protein/ActR/RegA family two-component response regulator